MSIADLFYENRMKKEAGLMEEANRWVMKIAPYSFGTAIGFALLNLFGVSIQTTGNPPTNNQVKQVIQSVQSSEENSPESNIDMQNRQKHEEGYQKYLDNKKNRAPSSGGGNMEADVAPTDYSGGVPPTEVDPKYLDTSEKW